MVAWDQAKTNTKADKKVIERLTLAGDTKVRFVGEVLPRYVYWVITKEGKKMPVECLQFNRQTEAFDSNARDPMKELPAEIYSEKPQFAYVCNVLDRTDGKIKLFDVKATVYKQIVDYARNPEYGNPADLEKGYDITIKKEKTGPLPQNVKYTCVPARTSKALSAEERALELYEVSKMYKRPTYEEQKKWLLDNTMLFSTLTDSSLSPEEVEDLK
jgi:hypothetical protein